jgi:hypothetical protein
MNAIQEAKTKQRAGHFVTSKPAGYGHPPNTEGETMLLTSKRIIILSGEGETGEIEEFTGKKTARAIKSRLTRERAGGDRWAMALQFVENHGTNDLFEDLETGALRHIQARVE